MTLLLSNKTVAASPNGWNNFARFNVNFQFILACFIQSALDETLPNFLFWNLSVYEKH